MISPDLEDKIRGLLAIAHPTEGQVQDVLNEWDQVFEQLQIPPEGQLQEFDGIMRARVQSGVISVRAPRTPPLWPIWIEGFAATGERGPASYEGTWPGWTFLDACRAWAHSKPERLQLFSEENGVPTYWGCRMFDAEAEARTSFG